MRAFLTYVRSLLEYNSVVWSPCYKQDMEAIERVQRRFSKRLPGLKNLSYQERILGWPTVELRRLRTDLICVIKYCLDSSVSMLITSSNLDQIKEEAIALIYTNTSVAVSGVDLS